MPVSSLVDIVLSLVALLAIGVGVGLKDPAWALVVVGGIVLGVVLASRLRGRKPE